MNWKLKCLALHALRFLPQRAHTALHRVTGRYYVTLTDVVLRAYRYHADNFRLVGGRAMEFGAGAHLLCPLLLSEAEAKEVLAYDLSRLASIEQVNHMIAQLGERLPGEWPLIGNLADDLERLYRIRYLAPADAQRTGLPAGSVDFFCSSSTLEHIPSNEIHAILTECIRIASPRARFSFIIDYHDHYASADPAIGRMNFYRYSDAQWRWFNPPNHCQNRLRHSDFVKLFAFHGLRMIEHRPVLGPTLPDQTRLHERFRTYDETDLTALNGYFHLAIIPGRSR